MQNTKEMDEHINYEMWMMWHCITEFMQPDKPNPPQVNVLNVAVYNAAHNLITYLVDEYEIELPKEVVSIFIKIQRQIRTLTNKRTAVMSEKLQFADMVALFKFVYSHREKLGVESRNVYEQLYRMDDRDDLKSLLNKFK